MTEKDLRELSQAEIHVERQLYRFGYAIHFLNKSQNKMASFSIEWKDFDISTHVPVENVLEVQDTQAQQLMDALWKSGIRPSNEVGSVGEKNALQSHLSDMRKIVGSKLKIDL